MQQGRWTAWSSIPTFSNWQLPARTPTSACMATENIELLASQTTVRCEDTWVTFRWPGIDCENTSLEVLWKYLSWGIVKIPLLGYCDWEDTNRRYYAYTWDTAIEAEMLPCIITISLTLLCAILNMCRKCLRSHTYESKLWMLLKKRNTKNVQLLQLLVNGLLVTCIACSLNNNFCQINVNIFCQIMVNVGTHHRSV